MDHAALRAQLAGIVAYAGEPWSFGGRSLPAIASPLQPDDPRLPGAADRMIELTVAAADLPAPAPVSGDDLSGPDGVLHRVARVDREPSGLVKILVAA